MSAFRTFEQFVQRLMEAPFARLTGTKLQPVELAKRLERDMETSRTIGVDRVYVPNHYTLALNPNDHASFAPFQASLAEELATYLRQRGSERGYTFVGPIDVQFESDPRIAPADVRITTALRERLRAAPSASAAPAPQVPPATRMLPIAEAADEAAPLVADAFVRIEGDDGAPRTVPLLGSVIRLGRGLDNDIVLESLSVSRNHAQVARLPDGGYSLEDLESTNGTLLNGKAVRQGVLRSGDVITFGAVTVVFEAEP